MAPADSAKTEIAPETEIAQFRRERFSISYSENDFSLGRAALCKPLFGVRMKSNFHVSNLNRHAGVAERGPGHAVECGNFLRHLVEQTFDGRETI